MWKCPNAASTQCTLMTAFGDVSGRSETSLSVPKIDNQGNDEGEERLGRVYPRWQEEAFTKPFEDMDHICIWHV